MSDIKNYKTYLWGYLASMINQWFRNFSVFSLISRTGSKREETEQRNAYKCVKLF